MFLLIIFIIFFYHYFLVSGTSPVVKPTSINHRYVDLNGNFYEKDAFLKESKDIWDYDTQTVIPPFDYSITLDSSDLRFSARGKEWKIPLLAGYHWSGDQIREKDECFGRVGNIAASGKKLFDYVRNHEFITSASTQTSAPAIPTNLSLFYFECDNDQIVNLRACPHGSIFQNESCVFLDECHGKPDGFTLSDLHNKYKFYECRDGSSHEKTCPPKQIFQYDQCKIPDNLCDVEPEGFTIKLSHNSYGKCVDGKMTYETCLQDRYFLDGKCEWEVCFEKHDEIVASVKVKAGPFSLYPFYGKCVHGRLTDVKMCPENWDTTFTNLDIVHLPQVFENGKCVTPSLCTNVRLNDPNAVVPSFHYAKHLATLDVAVYFDRTIGYKCNNGIVEPVPVPHGSLIKNFKIEPACKAGEPHKMPVDAPNMYFDCDTQTTITCPPRHFFDGYVCKKENKKAFSFNNHLSVFEFDRLTDNNWMESKLLKRIISKRECEQGEIYISNMDMCVHPECEPYLFIRELQRPIKLNDSFQCAWNGNKIIKQQYDNPYNLRLIFWQQKLVNGDTMDVCNFGEKLKTGNFVLDSTLYTTCKQEQPFIFCPSNSTQKIELVNADQFACFPHDSVYQYNLPKNTQVMYFRHEVDRILIPEKSNIRLNGRKLTFAKYTEYKAPINKPVFHFINYNNDTIIIFKTLANNPPNTFILNRQLLATRDPKMHYSLEKQTGTLENLSYVSYDLKDSITNFKY